jgi:hypothetical protein
VAQQIQSSPLNVSDLASVLVGELLDKVVDQRGNIFRPFPQRRHVDRENVQSVKQIEGHCLAERTPTGFRTSVAGALVAMRTGISK